MVERIPVRLGWSGGLLGEWAGRLDVVTGRLAFAAYRRALRAIDMSKRHQALNFALSGRCENTTISRVAMMDSFLNEYCRAS